MAREQYKQRKAVAEQETARQLKAERRDKQRQHLRAPPPSEQARIETVGKSQSCMAPPSEQESDTAEDKVAQQTAEMQSLRALLAEKERLLRQQSQSQAQQAEGAVAHANARMKDAGKTQSRMVCIQPRTKPKDARNNM